MKKGLKEVTHFLDLHWFTYLISDKWGFCKSTNNYMVTKYLSQWGADHSLTFWFEDYSRKIHIGFEMVDWSSIDRRKLIRILFICRVNASSMLLLSQLVTKRTIEIFSASITPVVILVSSSNMFFYCAILHGSFMKINKHAY